MRSTIHPSVLILCAASLLLASPARAERWNDQRFTFELRTSNSSSFFLANSSLSPLGPQWFRNAMFSSSAPLTQRSLIFNDSSSSPEAAYVGTLRDEFSADIAQWTSPLYRSMSGRISAPLAPDATNAIITWDGAGTASAWLSGPNWSTDTVPTGADTATFATTAGSTSIGINFTTGPINNGPANQAVGSIALTGGENKSISNSGAGAGTLTINGVGGNLLTNSSAFDLTLQNGAQPMTVALPNSGSIDVTSTGNIIISSQVTGAAAITKTGSGTLILSGTNNNYSGGTTISGGTLLANSPAGSSSTGSGAVTVNSGGTLGGSGFINSGLNNVTVDNGGTITGGTSGAVGTLTLTTSSLVMNGTYLVDLTASASDLLSIIGTLDLTSATDAITFQGTTGAASYTLATYTGLVTPLDQFNTVNNLPSGYDLVYGPTALVLVAVPEPSTWIGAGLALLAIGYTQRRRLRGLIPSRA